MKEINEMDFPDVLRYTQDHEWTESTPAGIRCGISDYAQNQLGDIVYVELPQVGETLEKGEEFGTVESVKAVAELYMPLGGEIIAVNVELEDSPQLVNQDPYGKGWMLDIKPSDPGELESLMTKEAYKQTLETLE
ncbi:MAG: glycine cleavage system protein GcvH [Deltaproteobacteria bacterium]|nr:glycine cleavage system protein GcvH [Deltaproteobacteria bacterium]